MRSLSICVFVLVLTALSLQSLAVRNNAAPPAADDAAYAQLKSEAEEWITDRSYAKANQAYQRAAQMTLTPASNRWVTFRIADTSWRAQAGTQTHDSTVYDKASEQLQAVISEVKRAEDRDLTWAQANESLGDFYWDRQNSQDWGRGWTYYQSALDYWASSGELDVARDRYLAIVWRMAHPAWRASYEHDYYYMNVPLEVLDNALKIAVSANDQNQAHYLIAVTLMRQGGGWREVLRTQREFEAAITAGKAATWYDDALSAYGNWLATQGPAVKLESGQWTRQPDFNAAVAVFRRLIREFKKGETSHYDRAAQMIEEITKPVVSVGVSNVFLPGSEIQYALSWRNIDRINLTLHQVDLIGDNTLEKSPGGIDGWVNRLDLSKSPVIKTWDKQTEDKHEHRPGQSIERFDKTLPPGAYVIEAAGSGDNGAAADVRELLLVTDAAVVLKTAGAQSLVFATNAITSAPIANAKVKIWKFTHDGQKWVSSSAKRDTDDSGLAHFDGKDFTNPQKDQNASYFAAINAEGRQAFGIIGGYWNNPSDEGWRIYAFTDRPAYRPKDTVQWKLVARVDSPTGFTTPADQSLEYEVTDPRGTKLNADVAKLSAFGSAWGSFELTDTMPLGEYRVTYWTDKEHNHQVGSAVLFRLEEYKLPEFQVSIKTPEENGKRKAYVLGDKVQVDVQADYYFGGPVANATVEVVINQNPYYRWWTPHRDFDWCYPENNPYRYWGGGGGQVVKRETIKTDLTGKAQLTFDTPENGGQNFEYRIEARVVDASRREITASDSVRVTQQRYYVQPQAKHNIHRPGDTVEIDFKAMDANDQPVTVEGSVKVTRQRWVEIWLDPAGQEVTGGALRDLQRNTPVFPPPPTHANARPWRLKFQGYESEDVLTTKVKLDAKGEGTLSFTPQNEGYYRIAWTSEDAEATGPTVPIVAETYAWVATDKSTELAYRHGGLEIVIDKDTFRAGQSAPVMISTPTNDRYVLFSVEGNDLYSYQVVHVTGTVKLVQVAIDQRHVPNIYLSAAMAHDGQLYQDTKEVVVPPVEQYLNVEVAADRSQYQPGEEGTFTIITKDHDGKPVSAEVAVGVSDQAVAYIQQDYAGDPRKLFFDQRQNATVQTGSSFQQQAYIKLAENDKKQLIDVRMLGMDLGGDEDGEVSDVLKEKDGDGGSLRSRRLSKGGRGGGFGGGSGGARFDSFADASGAVSEMAAKSLNMAAPGAPTGAADPAIAGQALNFGADRREPGSPGGKLGMEGKPGEPPAVQVRSDFRATLLWQPSVITDEAGTAKVTLKYADSLTSWNTVVRANGKGNQFGIANAVTRTKMPLIARLQAPRFFLVGDSVTISGVINNNTDAPLTVTPNLDAQGLTITALLLNGQPVKGLGITEIPANGETRIDWQVAVESAGTAKLKLTATSSKYADAMEKTYPIYEHGLQRYLVKSGKIRGNDVTFSIDLPSQRKVESTTLAVQVTPSMAVTMLDALPYLVDYPYGCTEQTMSRFLPAAITAKTLGDLGLKPELAMSKIFGGIEPATADKTHPKGKKDLAKLQEITNQSLDRLYDFQHADGGWGWWKEGESDHFMSAYVLWGLCLAKDANMDVRQDVIDKAAAWLDKEIVEEESSYDRQAWVLHALAAYHASMKQGAMSEFQAKALNNLWAQRDKLNAYTRAIVALAAHDLGDAAKAKTLVENLENGVKKDDRPDTSVIVKGVEAANEAVIGTAHWGEDGVWWRWSDGNVETTAFALRAMLAIDPHNKLIEPVTNWLIKNRRGSQWSNTRDTAIVVLAMNDYLRVSGELSPEMEYELLVNGKSVAKRKITTEDALSAPSVYQVERSSLRDGPNEVRIVRTSGKGPVYFSANASFFSLEEPVPASGNEIFVRRDYYKLVAKPTLLKGYIYDRVPMADGDSVKSGERVEVVMTIESKNNYEYLLFEDLKPAGLEAVEVRSGSSVTAREMKTAGIERTFGDGKKTAAEVKREQAIGDEADYTGRSQGVYQELRDRKVAMFLSSLPEGVWELRYSLRAETPGRFHALPVEGQAMYVPEIRCNSEETRISVIEESSK